MFLFVFPTSLIFYNNLILINRLLKPTQSPSHSPTASPTKNTNWSEISPLLEDSAMLPLLPIIPSAEDVSEQIYTTEPTGSDLYPFKIHRIQNLDETAGLCNDEGGLSAAMAGPNEICTSDNCNGPDNQGFVEGAELCRAVINAESIQLLSKFGTYYAKALNTPSWMTFTFPVVTEGTETFVFSFKLDDRYRPEMYGGNPCSAGSSSYDCDLCTVSGSWDHSMSAGVHILFSAAGRSEYIITGPYDLGAAYDADEFVQTFDVPAELNYSAGEYPVITLLVYSQYPAQGEVNNPSSCSIAQSDEIVEVYKDKTLMVRRASLMYRTGLELPTQPQVVRPRLYGNDTQWLANNVNPFFDAPCDEDTAFTNGGWL